MGILTLLRNAFGRSRKARATEPEGATQTPAHSPSVPEPRRTPAEERELVAAAEEHELVAAAFDKVKTPSDPPNTPEEPAPAKAEEPAEDPVPAKTEEKAEEPAPAKTEEKAEEPAPAKAEEEGAEEPAPIRTEDAPEEKAKEKATPTTPAQVEPEAEEGTEQPVTPEAEAKTETTEEPEPEPGPEADVEAEGDEVAVAAEATTAPQAADGEDAPQGPPAADDESRTGGAGGNTDAEGEAETDPAPQATGEAETDPAPQATDEAEADPAPQADDKPQPAIPLTRVRSRTPSLTTAYKAAAATLKKTDLTGTRAKVYLVLDRSASMRPYYKDGSAQALADQTLALAAHLDPEATVHVVFFSTEVDGTTDLTLAPDQETKIDDVHADLGRMGRTSYHAAVQAVVAHYEKNTAPGTPALVVFQTDGAPDAKTPATQSLTETATSHPAVFFSFVAFGDHDNKAFDYLRKLKTGNTSFFHAGPSPRELTDTELYEGVLATWRP
ncbi:VWA domain-containing protein [Streptomyces sp. MC1]|uniref:VWA domain-containing protein n=1 Tax=Streptomyces sp. MC1 TaxID=295105 RepID=UPI0018CB02AE|nr:VWA domain-containing protein [Streptomyces sp. MC1]MBG7701479.1 VWA domain-containing protein [Streptomyces sp. MC1]